MPIRNYIIEDMRAAMSGERPEHSITRAIFANDLKKTMERVDEIMFTAAHVPEAVRFMRCHVPGTVISKFSK